MKYLLMDENFVKEIIFEEDPVFPGVPVQERYAPDFVSKLRSVADDVCVDPSDIWDEATKAFCKQPHALEQVDMPGTEKLGT